MVIFTFFFFFFLGGGVTLAHYKQQQGFYDILKDIFVLCLSAWPHTKHIKLDAPFASPPLIPSHKLCNNIAVAALQQVK